MTMVKVINNVSDAPLDAYIGYRLTGGIFYIEQKMYPEFAAAVCRMRKTNHFTMDLASARHHSLIFDLDFKGQGTVHPILEPSVVDVIHSTLTSIFFPYVDHFSYILAMRPNSYGIHIHVPEFTIAHDDYILLCQQLQLKMHHSIPGKGLYKLDIMANAMFAGSCKPGTNPYKAVRFVYADERESHALDIYQATVMMEKSVKALSIKFKRRKNNAESIFRKLLFVNPAQFPQILNEYMMPVALTVPLYRLSYLTFISTNPISPSEGVDVATFTYKRDGSLGFISKGKKLLLGGNDFLKSHTYIQINSFVMQDFETKNHALKTWFERHSQCILKGSENHLFQKIHQTLREDNSKLETVKIPIRAVMQFNHGHFFIPVFYALCPYLKFTPSQLVQQLQSILDPNFHPLLYKLENIAKHHVDSIMADLTEQTIHYCGNNLYLKPKTMQDKLKCIVRDSQRAILSSGTQIQVTELLRSIQERYFPIRVLCMCNALKKPSRYYWNFLTESWQEAAHQNEINDHLNNLWQAIKTFVSDYRLSQPNASNDDVFEKFSTTPVVAAINSDTTMERITVQMDRHKWFIRLQDGTLDLLTDHIGGTVPEFFLSEKKLGIDIPRSKLMLLLKQQCPLVQLYELLTTKSFFLRYLKELFLDKTDNLFHTLREMIYKELPDFKVDVYSLSMLHFYTHLCKYMSFEFDVLMFMLDVLASIFIATNYERRFFILKGVTGNGKSKLFELLGKVFGGYYHNIQSDNLKPSNVSGNATPELASTLFSCRIVTLEELESKINETRVKQITGNSQVAFRNMYEQNTGGIPTAKVFSTTNKLPECQATQAFRERVIALPFQATFVEKSPEKTSEQVRLNEYNKDPYVVENSHRGCFLILYYHLRKHMRMEDGLLHYRKIPEGIQEYTNDYLANTDIYMQFKLHMDVQLAVEGITTMNDLKSAIRQFLKANKNLSTHETELVVKFEDEFGRYRKSDFTFNKPQQYKSFLDQIQPLVLFDASNNCVEMDGPPEEEMNVLKRKREEEGPSRKRSKTAKPMFPVEDENVNEEGPSRKRSKMASPMFPVDYENVNEEGPSRKRSKTASPMFPVDYENVNEEERKVEEPSRKRPKTVHQTPPMNYEREDTEGPSRKRTQSPHQLSPENYESVNEEEEEIEAPPKKRPKTAYQMSPVYYENVIIKNLKRNGEN